MIRTSGYYKKGEYDEVLKNSDFEKEGEGWSFVHFNDVTFDRDGAHCTMGTWDCKIFPKELIEIQPNDLFLIGISIKPEDCDNNEKFYLKIWRYDKFTNHRSDYYSQFSFNLNSGNIHTFYRLYSVAEIFNDYFDAVNNPRVIRAIYPGLWFDDDDWDENEKVCIKSFSMRRINPDKLKSLPMNLIDINLNDPARNTNYYGEECFTGIFKEADYLLYIDRLENAGSNDITLQVSIESYDVATQKWYDAVIFDDVVVQAEPTINQTQVKIATAGLGFYQRVRWYIKDTGGDGDPDQWRFKVGVTYKQ